MIGLVRIIFIQTFMLEKSDLVIIEASESSKGFFSLFLDEGVRRDLDGTEVLYWNSPSYKLPLQFNSLKNSSLADYINCHIGHQFYKDSYTLAEKLLDDSGLQKDVIPFCNFLRISYQGVAIGPSLISEICRFNYKAMLAEECERDYLKELIFARICSRAFIDILCKNYRILALFLTEWTYRIQDLVQYSVSINIPVPQFLEGIPFCHLHESSIMQMSLYQPLSGYSMAISRRVDRMKPFNIDMQKAALNEISRRLRSVKYIHKTSDTTIAKSIAFSKEISTICNARFISGLTKEVAKEDHHNIVLYLHAVTDGLYQYGFDGYLTPYHYFYDVCMRILENSKKSVNILIKIHPNLFHKDDSPYPSAVMLSQQEFYVTRKYIIRFVNQLKVCESLKANIYFIDPLYNLSDVVKIAGAKAIHVTQFGKVAIEALWLGQRAIYSEMAPYAFCNVGGWIWQNIQNCNNFDNTFTAHHHINTNNIVKYITSLSLDEDIHVPNRKWITYLASGYFMSGSEFSIALSDSKLRESARSTYIFEYIYRKYVRTLMHDLSSKRLPYTGLVGY